MLSRLALPLLFSVLALGGVGCTREKPIELDGNKGKEPNERPLVSDRDRIPGEDGVKPGLNT